MSFGSEENYFFLLSTGARLYKQDNMSSVLPDGLTRKVLCGLTY